MAIAFRCWNERGLDGIYHLVPNGYVNWSDFARVIFNLLGFYQGREIIKVNDILTSEYNSKVIRPLNSRMNNQKLLKVLPHGCVKNWEYYLKRTLSVLIERNQI